MKTILLTQNRVAVMLDRKMQSLGLFSSEEAAARAYDRVAIELFGEFAFLNFPEEVAA